MIPDRWKLDEIVRRVETGTTDAADAAYLRGLVQRLDELDDLVDAVCTCRTQEIPIIRQN